MRIDRRTMLSALMLAGASCQLPAWSQDAQGFDHGYAAWDALLKKHVSWLPDNKQSRVDYKAFALDHDALKKVLERWSAVTAAEFAAFTPPQQMAFLINAYNGFTVTLILSRYPNLKSIKELGSLFQSPWKKKFFRLLGEERHLDWIEHEQLRPRYADWRVHAALNCASIGCPALRTEAFRAQVLDEQLEDGMARFMSDRSRNRFADGRVELNEIFKWYIDDFQKGQRGIRKLDDLVLRYFDALGVPAADRQQIRKGSIRIRYLDYDWALNDIAR